VTVFHLAKLRLSLGYILSVTYVPLTSLLTFRYNSMVEKYYGNPKTPQINKSTQCNLHQMNKVQNVISTYVGLEFHKQSG